MPKNKTWAVFDCETDAFDYSGEQVEPFIWGCLTSEGDYSVFWDTQEFCDYVRASGIDYFYAHNGGKFDTLFPTVLANLEDGKIMLINGRLAKAKIGKSEIRDSFLCLPAPLAKFGEKDDFDYSKLDRSKRDQRATDFKQEIETYLHQDCVALFNAMARFILLYGFALTQAGASMKTWEAMGGEKRRYGKTHDEVFRPFYYGGRTQAVEYACGVDGDFKLYDINSSYPYAMTFDHPCGVDYFVSRDYENENPASFWTITAVSRGCLPTKTKHGTVYYNDDIAREYNCTGWELRAGLDTGTLDIISARGLVPMRFETMKPYVDKFYEERNAAKAAGDTIGDLLAKIFMNSLYGRYGMRSDEFMDYKIIPAGEDPNEYSEFCGVRKIKREYFVHMFCGDFEIVQSPAINKTYYDVALAASVTGLARANLWRAMCASKRVMYCDTDSILCEEFTGATGDKLGEWKLEAEIKRVWIAGKKCYAFELVKTEPKDDKKRGIKKGGAIYKTAHKGVSKLDIDVKDIMRAAAGESVIIRKSAPCMKFDGKQKFFSRTIRRT